MFREELERLVASCEGGVGAVLMGFDGIAVDAHVKVDGFDVTTACMEMSFLLGQVRKALEGLRLGALQEFVVHAERTTLILRVLTAEYFVALALVPDGNFGKGRYLLRIAAPRLQTEL